MILSLLDFFDLDVGFFVLSDAKNDVLFIFKTVYTFF